MDLFGEIENSEPEIQIIACRNKIQKLTEKIRDELQKRREIRVEIDQAKKRRTSQVLILERFDEYESVVRKELKLAEDVQDDDSMKQKVLIEQYENTLKEQEKVWSEYKVEYDDLPLAKELQKIKTDVLIINIQLELANYRLNEAKRNSNLLNNITKRREQIKIINFANLWIERRAQVNHCSELSSKIKNLQNKKRELESEFKNLEREVSAKEVTQEVTKPFVSRIPQIDLSQIFIHKRNNRDDCDASSLNSYVLEREYMNIDRQTDQLPHNNSTKNTQKLDDTETLIEERDDPESEEMALYDSNTGRTAQDFKRTDDSAKRVKPNSQESKASSRVNRFYDDAEVSQHNFKKLRIQSNQIQNMQNYMQTTENSTREYDHFHENKKSSQESQTNYSPRKSTFISKEQRNGQPDQTLKVQQSERNNEQNRRINANFQPKKKSNPEFQMNLYTNPYKNQDSMQMNDCNTAKKRGNQQQPNKDNMITSHRPVTCNGVDRPVPSPSKMAKCSAQDMVLQQQQFQQHHHHQQQQQQKLQRQQQQQQLQRSPRITPDMNNLSTDLSRLPQSNNKPVVKSCERVHLENMPIHFRQKAHPNPYAGAPAPSGTMMTIGAGQDDSSMEYESGIINVTPIKPSKGNIPPTSMMSVTMMDPTMWGDTISDIVGSEITETGGSFELAKRIHGDYSDLASEDEGFDYEKIMGKICSPMVPHDPQPGRFQTNANNQAPTNSNNEVQKPIAEVPNERNFTFGAFAKKPQTSQRLF